MIFKSYLIEQNIQSINNNKMFLFYGENEGLKKEFKDKLKTQYDKLEILNFSQDEIIKNKNILINEIINKSLFNEKKIIFLIQSNDKILDILEEVIENVQDEKIFFFSDILDKRSKLRSYFEKSTECGIAACYKDNEITIRQLITKKLNGYQGLTNEVINFIIQNTGLDRNKINNEIDKIISFFDDKKIELKKN